MNGTGAGQPRGVLVDPALIVISKESGQAPSTVLYDNLKKMLARMHPGSIKNAVWVASSTTIPELLSLVQVVGTAGSTIPVMRESDGGFQILTRPVLFTDFSQYVIGLRADATLDRSAHVGFTSDVMTWRAIVRVDAMGSWSQAYVPKNGSSLSWCVTLAART